MTLCHKIMKNVSEGAETVQTPNIFNLQGHKTEKSNKSSHLIHWRCGCLATIQLLLSINFLWRFTRR